MQIFESVRKRLPILFIGKYVYFKYNINIIYTLYIYISSHVMLPRRCNKQTDFGVTVANKKINA